MKDLIQNARAVEARLRDAISHPMLMINSVETINSLITALEAAQPTFAIDGMTPSQFAMRELYEFQEATGCDTAAQAKGKLEVAQKDAERYRCLSDMLDAEAVNVSFPTTIEGIQAEYLMIGAADLCDYLDAAIKAQGDAK